MSYDLFFQTGRFGDTPVERANPFTGEVRQCLPSEPLTPAEVAAVEAVLRQAGVRGPDEFGCYVIELGGGGTAQAFGERAEDSLMVALRGLTPGLLQLLYALLRAGNWVLIPRRKTASPSRPRRRP